MADFTLLPSIGLAISGDVVQDPLGTFSILGSNSYNNYVQSGPHDVTGKTVICEVLAAPTTTGYETTLQLRNPSNSADEVSIQIRNGQVRFRQDNGQLAAITFTGTPIWLRMSHEGSQIVYYTSADGSTWTERHRATAAFAVTNSNLRIFAYQSAGGTERSVVRRINSFTDPPGAFPGPTEPGAELWRADLTQTTIPAAFDATTTDTDATNLSCGSLIDTTLGGETRALLNIVHTAHKGYRQQTELTQVAAGFPRDEASLRFAFRIDTMGGIATADDVKFGYGLAGAPPNVNLSGISYGGTKLANSWSVRLTTNRAGYVASGVPSALAVAAYVYAEQVDGIPISSTSNNGTVYGNGGYGLRVMLKNGGAYFTPVAGQVYNVELLVKKNTPGVQDGHLVVLVDGVVWAAVPVMWNPAGQDIGVGYFINQTFSNTTLTEGRFHLGEPAIYVPEALSATLTGVTGSAQVWRRAGSMSGVAFTNAELAREFAAPILRRLARMRRSIRRRYPDTDAGMHGRGETIREIDVYGR